MNNRYYANVQGANPDAIVACLKKANEIIANDPDVGRIVLYSYTKAQFRHCGPNLWRRKCAKDGEAAYTF